MKDKIVIGTRSSQLALWQADYVADKLKQQFAGLLVEKKLISTKGDKILDTALAKIGGKGVFTKELETAMAEGEIDLAVHSLKDMPTEPLDGLVIAAITERENPVDALVSDKYTDFASLPEGAKVGTSSLRRKAQLLNARPDLQIHDLRGNVNTRIRKMREEGFDAIILAAAGMRRLGFDDLVRQEIPYSLCLPAAGQGALALETRGDDTDVIDMLSFLDNGESRACVTAERAFLATVGGGCQVPVGAHAVLGSSGEIVLEAIIASLDGKTIVRDRATGINTDGERIGHDLAEKMLDLGGRSILKEIGIEI